MKLKLQVLEENGQKWKGLKVYQGINKKVPQEEFGEGLHTWMKLPFSMQFQPCSSFKFLVPYCFKPLTKQETETPKL